MILIKLFVFYLIRHSFKSVCWECDNSQAWWGKDRGAQIRIQQLRLRKHGGLQSCAALCSSIDLKNNCDLQIICNILLQRLMQLDQRLLGLVCLRKTRIWEEFSSYDMRASSAVQNHVHPLHWSRFPLIKLVRDLSERWVVIQAKGEEI